MIYDSSTGSARDTVQLWKPVPSIIGSYSGFLGLCYFLINLRVSVVDSGFGGLLEYSGAGM